MTLVALLLALQPGSADPHIVRVGAVAPDTVSVVIEGGRVEVPQPEPFVRQAGDEVLGKYVKRGGVEIGVLAGPDQKLVRWERMVGSNWDLELADDHAAYRVTGRTVRSVARKSIPKDLAHMAGWKFDAPMRHTVYLELDRPLAPGAAYTVTVPSLPPAKLVFEPAKVVSEAIHVTQLGFRPDDPGKFGFLSQWKGNGGAQEYEPDLTFQVVDAKTAKPVFTGKTAVALDKASPDDRVGRNYSKSDVWLMDFSELRTPGTYRLVVDGIGCSLPFRVAADVWKEPFRVAARGLYHQRRSIGQGPPYTTFKAQRDFHPADGVKIFASECSLLDSGNGLNALGTDKDNFGNLVKGKTDRLVPEAWGGYHDAGDWDSRIQHLSASRQSLELAELCPSWVESIDLNIPDHKKGVPDLVTEARWNLDHYRRMQLPDGGIRGGVESEEHPNFGETSWTNTLTVLTYAPDPWSSFIYAGDAARMAWVLGKYAPAEAAPYRESAIRAYDYAVRELPKLERPRAAVYLRDTQNLAALCLLRLTQEARYRTDYLATSMLKDSSSTAWEWEKVDQRDAGFLAARMPGLLPADAVEQARAATLRHADIMLESATKSGFRLSKAPWNPLGYGGATSAIGGIACLRAYELSTKPEYLLGAVRAIDYTGGANPANLCYTTGLGLNPVKNALQCDARTTAQPIPAGLTVYGPFDPGLGDLPEKEAWQHHVFPDAKTWPAHEMYIDGFRPAAMAEYTVMETLGPTVYVWGWLGGRRG